MNHAVMSEEREEPNHNWCVGCSPDNCSGCGAAPLAHTTPQHARTAELEQLTARIAALELEVASLRSVLADVIKAHGYAGGTPIEVLSTPFTPTTLHELIEKVEKMTIERCAVVTAWSIIDMPTTVEFSTVRKYSKAIRALPVGQIDLKEIL